MKIFWSWQSDTHGDTGRHFVRAALIEAIEQLRQPTDVEEPRERDIRQALHLDQDRQGVSGTPPIAQVIFDKIDKTDVFVADVTPIAQLQRLNPSDGEPAVKKVINPNVAIEYGYAVRAVGDQMILLVQNTHCGNRDDLPFDLKHKGGPFQYSLAPSATKAERAAAKRKLVGDLVVDLRACLVTLSRSQPAAPKFEEVPFTSNRAFFWQPGEILAQHGHRNPPGGRGREDDEVYQYRFDQPQALYLRLIPTLSLPELFGFDQLMEVLRPGRVRLMTRHSDIGSHRTNKYGAIAYEISGTNTTPMALTELHTNGEIWAITREPFMHHAGEHIVAMDNVRNSVSEGLQNAISVARDDLRIEPPYEVEVGIVGLKGLLLTQPEQRLSGYVEQFTDPLYDNESHIRRKLHDVGPVAQGAIVRDFLKGIYRLVGIDF